MNKVLKLEEIIQQVKKVKIEDLKRIAETIFRNSNLNLALIGPIEDKDKGSIEKGIDDF